MAITTTALHAKWLHDGVEAACDRLKARPVIDEEVDELLSRNGWFLELLHEACNQHARPAPTKLTPRPRMWLCSEWTDFISDVRDHKTGWKMKWGRRKREGGRCWRCSSTIPIGEFYMLFTSGSEDEGYRPYMAVLCTTCFDEVRAPRRGWQEPDVLEAVRPR
jgi:hypothetical protein